MDFPCEHRLADFVVAEVRSLLGRFVFSLWGEAAKVALELFNAVQTMLEVVQFGFDTPWIQPLKSDMVTFQAAAKLRHHGVHLVVSPQGEHYRPKVIEACYMLSMVAGRPDHCINEDAQDRDCCQHL